MSKTNVSARIVISVLLLLLITGCGSNAEVRSSAGLFHVETSPVNCIFNRYGPSKAGNLVLTNSHANTYDSSEMQQIESYAQALANLNANEPPLPATLHWFQGGPFCGAGLEITNVSKSVVQIQSIDMRVTAAPLLNTTHYELLDVCSFLSASERVACPGSFGGGPPLLYTYKFEKASKGSLVHPQNPGPIVLKPSDIAYIGLTFSSTGVPDNFIYTVVPELVLTTSSMELQSDTMKVVFADTTQFSCVHLSRNTFVSESPIPPPLLVDGSPSGHWCI